MATALPLIAMGISVAAGAASAAQAAQASKAQQRQAKYMQEVAKNDAIQARWQAAWQADQIRRKNLRIKAAQRAGFLKNRVALTGSAEDVMRDSEVEGELNALAALYSGEVEAGRETAKADLYKAQGESAATSGKYAMAGSLLGGIGQGMGSYAAMKNPSFEARGTKGG